MQKFVNVQALNSRGALSTESNAPLGQLSLGQAVVDLADGPPGWYHITTRIGSSDVTGFCIDGLADKRIKWTDKKQLTLRDPVSPNREVLVAAAVEQWLLFEKGESKEIVEPFSSFVGKMWKAFSKNVMGKDLGVPWSSVAISLMVRNATQHIC